MSRSKNSGYIVRILADNRKGRTYHSKEKVNGKIPVYLEETVGKFNFSQTGTLFTAEQMKVIGMID